MDIGIKKEEGIAAILDEWYHVIHNDDKIASAEYEKQANSLADNIVDPKDFLYFKLLKFRHNILMKNFSNCQTLISEINPLITEQDKESYFLFKLFLGIHYFNLKEYDESLQAYKKAEKTIKPFIGSIKNAELNFRIAIVHYHTRKTFSAINYGKKARKLYSRSSLYDKQITQCEVLLGLCSISLNNYIDAEVFFLEALDHAKSIEAHELTNNIRFNLGYLYSEQNLSKVAIRHLEHVLTDKDCEKKTAFLLAREHYKLREFKTAQYYINLGYEICKRLNDDEYIYHLNILNALNSNSSLDALQAVVTEAVKYFKQNNLWGFVQDYCEMLGKKLFLSKEEKTEASEYYHTAYEAKQFLI